jgi:hypothetical protein
MTVQITSEEINLIIYNYLLETGMGYVGLGHSAFTLQNEARIGTVSQKFPTIQPGYLVSLLEKALILTQYEAHLHEEVIFNLEHDQSRYREVPLALLPSHTSRLYLSRRVLHRKWVGCRRVIPRP